jgi:hypothetical protein
MVILLVGCTVDPRPQALRRGVDQARSVLADPRLKELASKSKSNPKSSLEERLVEALFSFEARKLWPPRLAQEYDYSSRDQSKLPGRIAYLQHPDLPWSVVIKPDPENGRILLLGYGASLQQPTLSDEFKVQP